AAGDRHWSGSRSPGSANGRIRRPPAVSGEGRPQRAAPAERRRDREADHRAAQPCRACPLPAPAVAVSRATGGRWPNDPYAAPEEGGAAGRRAPVARIRAELETPEEQASQTVRALHRRRPRRWPSTAGTPRVSGQRTAGTATREVRSA